MFRKVVLLPLFAALSICAGCTSGQPSSQAGPASVVPTQRGERPEIQPDKDCGGTGHVRVTPCPVRLTKHTTQGVIVTVRGRRVADSEIGRINSCFNGQNCYNLARVGSSRTQWLITSGESCGAADVEIDAMNAHGRQVGLFFLKVSNKYCP